jgi:holo-[acyl-carrier protein] synthase
MSWRGRTTSEAVRPGRPRVGVDLVSVDDVQSSMTRYGVRYAQRLFTEQEMADTAGPAQASGLAARFAAKEATMKVLEPHLDPPGWRSIEVVREAGGRCAIQLHDVADQMATAAGLEHWALSMSHEGPMAVAVVIATSREAPAAVMSGRARRQQTGTWRD